MANALHQEIFAALGFEPMSIDVKDLVQAVRSHAVDAQENPLTNTVNFGLYRTHGHVSLTSHFFGVAPVLVNRARWEAWPEPVREAVRAGVRAATGAQRGFAAAEDADCLERLREAGVRVLGEAEIDWAGFEAAVAGIRRRELARLDPSLAAELGPA
jgi:TRAP-type C4-dicarboxylate transport system substrate-binding protein